MSNLGRNWGGTPPFGPEAEWIRQQEMGIGQQAMSNPVLVGKFSSAEITYAWHCSACDAVELETWHAHRNDELLIPSVPKGWREYGRLFFCPKHSIELLVDGKAWTR